MPRAVRLTLQAVAIGAVAGLLALLVWRVTHQAKPTRIGKPVPSFSLRRLDGEGKVSLASLRGRPFVLNFWASWCDPCKTESPALERLWQRYRAHGVVFLGIDYHDVSRDARRFVRKLGLTYPMLRDGSGAVGDRYDLTGVPETFVVDRRGRLVVHLQGPIDGARNADAFGRALRKALQS